MSNVIEKQRSKSESQLKNEKGKRKRKAALLSYRHVGLARALPRVREPRRPLPTPAAGSKPAQHYSEKDSECGGRWPRDVLYLAARCVSTQMIPAPSPDRKGLPCWSESRHGRTCFTPWATEKSSGLRNSRENWPHPGAMARPSVNAEAARADSWHGARSCPCHTPDCDGKQASRLCPVGWWEESELFSVENCIAISVFTCSSKNHTKEIMCTFYSVSPNSNVWWNTAIENLRRWPRVSVAWLLVNREVTVCSRYESFVRCVVCKYFLLISIFSLHFLYINLHKWKCFNLEEVQFVRYSSDERGFWWHVCLWVLCVGSDIRRGMFFPQSRTVLFCISLHGPLWVNCYRIRVSGSGSLLCLRTSNCWRIICGKGAPFLRGTGFAPLSKISWAYFCEAISGFPFLYHEFKWLCASANTTVLITVVIVELKMVWNLSLYFLPRSFSFF